MKFIVLSLLNFFDFFYKKKIIVNLKNLTGIKVSVFFDVGAHKGETVNFILKYFNVDETYAFEPLEKNFLKLKKNINRARFKKKN